MSALGPLLLKLALAPSLVAVATLAGRRYGPRASGWLIGFPLVAGPILWFYAREQGAAFAARAAAGTVLGLIALCGFILVHAHAALRSGWALSVGLGWVAFTGITFLVARIRPLAAAPWWLALIIAFVALAITRRLLPRIPLGAPARPPRGDLPARMAATAALVAGLTGVAHALGPTLSGLFTPFPVATTILVVFAQREGGAGGVAAVHRGFIPSLHSFAAFCAIVSFGLSRWSVTSAFVVALAVAFVSQAIVLHLVERAHSRARGQM